MPTRDGFTETLLLLPRCYQLSDHAQLYTHVFKRNYIRIRNISK